MMVAFFAFFAFFSALFWVGLVCCIPYDLTRFGD